MLTEFGAVSKTEVDIDLIQMMLERADEHMQSWAYWTFKSFDDITTIGNPDGGETFYNKAACYIIFIIVALFLSLTLTLIAGWEPSGE